MGKSERKKFWIEKQRCHVIHYIIIFPSWKKMAEKQKQRNQTQRFNLIWMH